MDIYQLKYFISAASIGNFTLAALENNISQSSFSKQIMNLENELGTQLFTRKKRMIELTPAGEQFQEYAFQMMSTYEEMLRGMESYSAFQTLPIGIASIPVILPYSLEKIIFQLNESYPDIIFSVMERAESTEVLHLLHKGDCDFAILRSDFLEKDKYNIYPIVEDELVAVLPQEHSLANRKSISIAELKDSRFVMPPEGTDLQRITKNACVAAGFLPEVAYITSGNMELTLHIVENQSVVYLAFKGVISYYMQAPKSCKLVEIEERIKSYTAFVSFKTRVTTRVYGKITQFLEEKYGTLPA